MEKKSTIMQIKRYIQLTVTVIIVLLGINGKAQRSFVQEDVVKVTGVTSNAQLYGLPIGDRNTSRTYVDGLGRSSQSVTLKGSPQQKDLVQFSEYDQLGRQVKSYLPYAATTATGLFRTGALTEQAIFYSTPGEKHAKDGSPYSQQVFDNSPLQRVLKAGSVGAGYQTNEHYKTYSTRTNTSGETIRRWNSDGSAASSYAVGTLNVTIGTDEEGSETIVYTNNEGQTVLKKQYVNEGGVSYVETYYVYSDAGQLLFVIPPKAVNVMDNAGNYALSQTAVQKLIFSYVYDAEGKQVERTVPGAGVVYMVYDPLDRLVLAQDAKLRTGNKWNYIKYDSRGVAVSQGIYTDGTYTSRGDMQAYVSGLNYGSNYFEVRNSSSGTGYYSKVCFPTGNIEPLAYSYYDDYDLDGNGSADFAYVAQGLTSEATATELTNGMPTMVSKRTVGSGLANIWLTSVMFYDREGRTIQVQGNNQLTSTMSSHQTMVPNFIGQTIRTKAVQVAGSNSTIVYSELLYDHMGRLKSVDEKYNSSSFIRIAEYFYNEMGQLIDKKLHSTNGGSTYLQSVDYRYTIRGQLASINNSTLANDDSNDDSNDVFGMNLIYEYNDAGISNSGKYNGLVTAIKWKANAPGVASTTNERSYKFSYDKLMRLNAANYADRSGSGSWGNAGAYDEKGITYDRGGNILTMQRRAVISGSATDVDNLSYSYDGNRLDNVSDGSGGSYAIFGFKNLTGSGTAYGYDVNGNMTSDAKKGMTLDYNVLNRTERVTITTATGRYIDYTYGADGTLIRKQAYDGGSIQKTTDYIGGFTYENDTLAYFAMAEGRVRNAGGTLTNEYIIKDQQGNARISFEDNAGSVLVRQENSYYPFGLSMPGNSLPTSANKKLYNGGSEWQDDFADLPDLQQTFYRNYDPALGRFVAVDPVAESAEGMTTYQYAMNNPVMFNDPMGDQAAPITGTYGGFHGGYGRIGSGSGNAWSDGIDRSDWNAYDGSASYRREIAEGAWDINGVLYSREERSFWSEAFELASSFGGSWSEGKGFVSNNSESTKITATILDTESSWFGRTLDRLFSGKPKMIDGNKAKILPNLWLHSQVGDGKPVIIRSATLDFSYTNQRVLGLDKLKVGQKALVNLFNAGVNPYSLAFGKIYMIAKGNNEFEIEANDFDWNIERDQYKNAILSKRNLGTAVGWYTTHIIPAGWFLGGDFLIMFMGKTKIPK
jgi:RHS repeat-associated protein